MQEGNCNTQNGLVSFRIHCIGIITGTNNPQVFSTKAARSHLQEFWESSLGFSQDKDLTGDPIAASSKSPNKNADINDGRTQEELQDIFE